MKTMLPVVVVLMLMGLGLTLAGCQAGGAGDGVTAGGDAGAAGVALEAVQPVEIVSRGGGSDAALDAPALVLVASAAELEALGVAGIEPVDFGSHEVLVLALGEQPTGGYWAHITAVQRVGDTLYVQGLANKPGSEAMVTQAVTYPYAYAVIEKTGAARVLSDIEPVVGRTPPWLTGMQ